eukprot:4320169-Prymnesium_polylepis.2
MNNTQPPASRIPKCETTVFTSGNPELTAHLEWLPPVGGSLRGVGMCVRIARRVDHSSTVYSSGTPTGHKISMPIAVVRVVS